MLNDVSEDPLLTAATKGIPSGTAPLALSAVGLQGWNILAGHCPLPIAVLREDILNANSAWMMAFVRRHGLLISPHGKTTMAPALFNRQLRDGAWAITVATSQQMQVCLNAGIRRIIFANQPIGESVRQCFLAIAQHPDLHLYVLADSVEGVSLLARESLFHHGPPIRVLIEVGSYGARTGCRDVPQVLAVAEAIAAAPALLLSGVEAFEGVLADTQAVDQLLRRVTQTLQILEMNGLFGDEIIVSAGGTGFFDLVACAFSQLTLGRPLLKVLRSGCYLVHDEYGYAKDIRRIEQEHRTDLPTGTLQPALEIWSYVQSRPDSNKAILTLGKRDIGYDNGLPHPVAWFRSGMSAPQPLDAGHRIDALNDQHAHLGLPTDSPLEVGDMVSLGIGHACTTFERWKVIFLVDPALNVTGAIRTFF